MGKMKGLIPATIGGAILAGAALAAAGTVSKFLGVELPHIPVLEVVTGAICLIWLMVILKYPWDLYFEARDALADILRSKENKIPVAGARELEVRRLLPRLLALAIFSHIGSAALVAALAWFSHGDVGWWFAIFYLVSTAFRPAATGYRHLLAKIRRLADEVRFPREDVLTMRGDVERHSRELDALRVRAAQAEHDLAAERTAREAEERRLREQVTLLGREFETTLSRLTDNQDVIRGIQAFVRLIGRADA